MGALGAKGLGLQSSVALPPGSRFAGEPIRAEAVHRAPNPGSP